MASSIVGGGNKYRDYLSDEELKNTKWRNGPPSYDVVDKLFEQERTHVCFSFRIKIFQKSSCEYITLLLLIHLYPPLRYVPPLSDIHSSLSSQIHHSPYVSECSILSDTSIFSRVWAEGSVEDNVQRLLKTWEMELVHKIDPNEMKSVDPTKFKKSVNGRKGLTPEEAVKLGGGYNTFLQTSLPENLRVYNPEDETFESSQNVFRSIFVRGFAIEVLHVYSGPPEIVYKFRHWGYMDGPFKGYVATGQLVELFGIGIFELEKESNKIVKAEFFFDRGELLGPLMKGGKNGESTSEMALLEDSKCPFMK